MGNKVRVQELHIWDEERPQRRLENPKKKGRIQVDEKDFPIKKKDSWIGKNKRDANRR